jgi:hypothetical protein
MKKNKIWILPLIIIVIVIYNIISTKKENESLKNGEIVVATIKDISYTRNSWDIRVQYSYKGRLMNGLFSTYNIDSLQRNQHVIIKISPREPDKFIKYIGVSHN